MIGYSTSRSSWPPSPPGGVSTTCGGGGQARGTVRGIEAAVVAAGGWPGRRGTRLETLQVDPIDPVVTPAPGGPHGIGGSGDRPDPRAEPKSSPRKGGQD